MSLSKYKGSWDHSFISSLIFSPGLLSWIRYSSYLSRLYTSLLNSSLFWSIDYKSLSIWLALFSTFIWKSLLIILLYFYFLRVSIFSLSSTGSFLIYYMDTLELSEIDSCIFIFWGDSLIFLLCFKEPVNYNCCYLFSLICFL